jgi:mono/diheme cytochrome c family protein
MMPAPALRALCALVLALPLAARAQEPAPVVEPALPEAVAGPDPLARGKYLAAAGNCVTCHTAPGGELFAGGRAFHTDFGTIYSTNITPHPEAGLGGWTEAQFVRAMRDGVSADGTHLYPAFPYTAFAKVSDEDLREIFAYLKSIPPSAARPPANAMGFPFNQRALMRVWNALFFDAAPFAPDPQQSAEWNRGAYLVQGLGHCGACHTPRNALGAEQADQALSGGVFMHEVPGGEVRKWSGVNLTSADSGLKAWSVEDIATYLQTGHSNRSASFGPMNEVIGNSTRHLSEADNRAIAVYLKSLPPIERSPKVTPDEKIMRDGETQYTIHCGTCHLPTGLGAAPGTELGAPLVGSAVAQAENPASLINIILYGGQVLTPVPPRAWKSMKPLGNDLDDDQVAAIATYVRASWGNRGAPVTAADVAKQR